MAEVEVKLTIFQAPVLVDENEIPALRSQGLIEDEPAAADKPAGPAGGKPDTSAKETKE